MASSEVTEIHLKDYAAYPYDVENVRPRFHHPRTEDRDDATSVTPLLVAPATTHCLPVVILQQVVMSCLEEMV